MPSHTIAERRKKRVTSFSQFDQGAGTAAARQTTARQPDRPNVPPKQSATPKSATPNARQVSEKEIFAAIEANRRRVRRLGF